jgi:WD40 repeat protein
MLACSNDKQVCNNLVWSESQRQIIYTAANVIIIENLNSERTQRLIKEGNDDIYGLKQSPDGKVFIAWTRTGEHDGFPVINVYDQASIRRQNTIAVSDEQIEAVEFSAQSNMLLVISSNKQSGEIASTLTVWDFIDGHREIFCKSMVPLRVKAAAWNPFIKDNADEFVSISDRVYHYWRISKHLELQYQEGELPKVDEGFDGPGDKFNCLSFVKPDHLHHSVYCMVGMLSGYIWMLDTRTNQYLFKVKALNDGCGGVQRIISTHSRIVVEPAAEAKLYCWDQSGKNGENEYNPANPFNFFAGVESHLTVDGLLRSTYYDGTANQVMALSTSGSIWYMNWIENATLRLKACHSPLHSICAADFKYISPSEFNLDEQDGNYVFDQNYQVASASSDGQLKLWNMYDLEYTQQFVVPKERCICIAMHQFKPFMVASFTDGFIRFFDAGSSKLLGRC